MKTIIHTAKHDENNKDHVLVTWGQGAAGLRVLIRRDLLKEVSY